MNIYLKALILGIILSILGHTLIGECYKNYAYQIAFLLLVNSLGIMYIIYKDQNK